jgi:glutamine synthetase
MRPGAPRRIEAALADDGIEAVVGHEMEFVLVNPDGSRLPSTPQPPVAARASWC